eukprot:9122181-Pyramimonas_sp.AAC.1
MLLNSEYLVCHSTDFRIVRKNLSGPPRSVEKLSRLRMPLALSYFRGGTGTVREESEGSSALMAAVADFTKTMWGAQFAYGCFYNTTCLREGPWIPDQVGIHFSVSRVSDTHPTGT